MSQPLCFCRKPTISKQQIYCKRHYSQWKRNGTVVVRSTKDPNDFIIENGECWIVLFNKAGEQIAITLIDIGFLPEAKKHKWHLSGYYACTSIKIDGKWRTTRLHNFILPDKKGYIVDHRNTVSLDNRSRNLRYITHQQNGFNANVRGSKFSSNYKGVYFKKDRNKFVSTIVHNGIHKHLGYFDDEMDAANAYDKAAMALRPEFCKLNNEISNVESVPF